MAIDWKGYGLFAGRAIKINSDGQFCIYHTKQTAGIARKEFYTRKDKIKIIPIMVSCDDEGLKFNYWINNIEEEIKIMND